MIPLLVIFIFVGLLCAAAWNDLYTMLIPNWISLALVAGFFVVIPFAWQGWANLGEHVLVGLTCFFVCLVLWALGGFGGGDAKLLAATSFWWTWPDVMTYLIYTALIGGLLALVLWLGRKYCPPKLLTSKLLYKQFQDETKIPYAFALAAGALITLPGSDLFTYVTRVGGV